MLAGVDGLEQRFQLHRLDQMPVEAGLLGLLANTRYIAMTGFGQASDRQQTQEAGFHRHLVKPVELEALLQAIDAG